MYLKNHVNLLSRKSSTASHPSVGIFFPKSSFFARKEGFKNHAHFFNRLYWQKPFKNLFNRPKQRLLTLGTWVFTGIPICKSSHCHKLQISLQFQLQLQHLTVLTTLDLNSCLQIFPSPFLSNRRQAFFTCHSLRSI